MNKVVLKRGILFFFVFVFGLFLLGCGKKENKTEDTSKVVIKEQIPEKTSSELETEQQKEYAELISEKDYKLHTRMESEGSGNKINMEMIMQKYKGTLYIDYVSYPAEGLLSGMKMNKIFVKNNIVYVNYTINEKNIWTSIPSDEDNKLDGFVDLDKFFAKMEKDGKKSVKKEIKGQQYACYEKALLQSETFCFKDRILKYMLLPSVTIKVIEYTNNVSDPLFEQPKKEDIITPDAFNTLLGKNMNLDTTTK